MFDLIVVGAGPGDAGLLTLRGKELLERAVEKFGLSARAYHRILKVSRTIADLDGNADIDESHVAEAIQYRLLDKKMVA